VSLLLANQADINLPDELGRTAIMHCVINNDIDMAKLLLASKQVDLNKQDSKRGFTAVHYAIDPTEFGSYENVALLKLLASKGANINLQDNKKRSPMYYVRDQITTFSYF